jgi:hydroxylamine dehydrogenase
MPFRNVFIAVVIGMALLVAAFMINAYRPPVVIQQPTASFVRASGKCAECHSNQQYSIVHEYELSAHARKGINCLDCHRPAIRQSSNEHHGFVIATHLTAARARPFLG